jgi:hypothetical protein
MEERLPSTRKTLHAALVRRGHVVPGDDADPEITMKLGGGTHRVLRVPLALVDDRQRLHAVPSAPAFTAPGSPGGAPPAAGAGGQPGV